MNRALWLLLVACDAPPPVDPPRFHCEMDVPRSRPATCNPLGCDAMRCKLEQIAWCYRTDVDRCFYMADDCREAKEKATGVTVACRGMLAREVTTTRR